MAGYGGTTSGKNLAGWVIEELQGTETAIVRFSSRVLNIFNDDVLAPSSGNLLHYGACLNAEGKLVTLDTTPLLVHFESTTAKPRASGGQQRLCHIEIEKPACYYVHTA